MMMCPASFVKRHENESFDELFKTRDALINDIKELEKVVFFQDMSNDAWYRSPSPDVVYQVYLEYLAELCLFIDNKYNREFASKRSKYLIR